MCYLIIPSKLLHTEVYEKASALPAGRNLHSPLSGWCNPQILLPSWGIIILLLCSLPRGHLTKPYPPVSLSVSRFPLKVSEQLRPVGIEAETLRDRLTPPQTLPLNNSARIWSHNISGYKSDCRQRSIHRLGPLSLDRAPQHNKTAHVRIGEYTLSLGHVSSDG